MKWLMKVGSSTELWKTCALFGYMYDEDGQESAVVDVDVIPYQNGLVDFQRFAHVQLLQEHERKPKDVRDLPPLSTMIIPVSQQFAYLYFFYRLSLERMHFVLHLRR